MAETIKIEIYRQKNAEDFTAVLADPDSRLETGSGAAATAAVASAFLCRAAGLTARTAGENERVAYIARNAEILRKYMVHLIDEDVHSRGPLRRAMNEGGAQEIEAARQPAVSIAREIVNMMGQLIDLAGELAAICPHRRHVGQEHRRDLSLHQPPRKRDAARRGLGFGGEAARSGGKTTIIIRRTASWMKASQN